MKKIILLTGISLISSLIYEKNKEKIKKFIDKVEFETYKKQYKQSKQFLKNKYKMSNSQMSKNI